MKVQATKDYPDKALGRTVKKGETLDVSDNRGKILIDAGVAEAVTAKRPAVLEYE